MTRAARYFILSANSSESGTVDSRFRWARHRYHSLSALLLAASTTFQDPQAWHR
jgi:hypothetical protein